MSDIVEARYILHMEFSGNSEVVKMAISQGEDVRVVLESHDMPNCNATNLPGLGK